MKIKLYHSSLLFDSDLVRTIVSMIFDNHGNLKKTAHELNIHRATLYRKIDKYKLWPIVFQVRKENSQRLALEKKAGKI